MYFITGNKNKYREAKAVLGDVVELEQLDIDLPEIQDKDAKNIVKSKLTEATQHHKGEFIVEDTSLHMDCLGGLPGPLVKWFLETIGPEGLYNIAEKLGNNKATARTIIGYAKNPDELYYFEGEVEGELVEPKTKSGFGWDVVFKPNSAEVTYAELSEEEKNKISHRSKAFKKFKEFMENPV